MRALDIRNRPERGRSLVFAVLLGFFVAAFLLFLYQGLQIGDFDDWDHLLTAHDISWEKLLKNFSSFRTGSTLWTGQWDRLNEVYHRRVFLTVVLKSVQSAFGISQTIGYFVCSKLIFFLGTTLMVFFLLVRMTRSPAWSLGGAIFYALVPAHYPHLFWLTDPVTMVHCFILVQLWFFYSLFRKHVFQEHPRIAAGCLAGLFATGWLAAKTKEPALVFEFAALLFLCVQWKQYRGMRAGYYAAIAILLLVIYSTVPRGDVVFTTQGYTFCPATIARMLFRNFACGYIDEPATAWISPAWLWPVSLSRTFNFFLLWLLAFTSSYLLAKKLQRTWTEDARFLASFALLWIMVDVLLMGFFQPDPRYFSGTTIPIVLLGTILLKTAAAAFTGRGKVLYALILALALAWSVGNNVRSIYWLRWKIGKMNMQFRDVATAVYRDMTGRDFETPLEMGRFYCSKYVPDPSILRLEKVACKLSLSWGGWDHIPGEGISEGSAKACAENGYFYYGTLCGWKGLTVPDGLELLQRIPLYSGPGVFDALVRRFVKPRRDDYCLYKIPRSLARSQ